MDLRFWNYVIPDGSTTHFGNSCFLPPFWNYVIPDGSTTERNLSQKGAAFWNYVIPDGSTTRVVGQPLTYLVLELCHSRWFYY